MSGLVRVEQVVGGDLAVGRRDDARDQRRLRHGGATPDAVDGCRPAASHRGKGSVGQASNLEPVREQHGRNVHLLHDSTQEVRAFQGMVQCALNAPTCVMPSLNRIKEIRLSLGLSQARTGELADLEGPQVSRYETGATSLFNNGAHKLAKALNVPSPADFIMDRSSIVHLVGYVGAGAEVVPSDELTDWIEAPPGLQSGIAVRVKGNSMTPVYKDGDIIYADQRGASDGEIINKDCIVEVADGRRLIKRVHRGASARLFRLFSYETQELTDDLELTWASPVLWVKRQ